MYQEHQDSLGRHTRIGIITILHNAPQLHSTRYILPLTKLLRQERSSLNIDPTIPFWKISRNPTFSVPSEPQSPTLLGSYLGTNPYVLRPLWDLLLSN